jgi:hypothetical protein
MFLRVMMIVSRHVLLLKRSQVSSRVNLMVEECPDRKMSEPNLSPRPQAFRPSALNPQCPAIVKFMYCTVDYLDQGRKPLNCGPLKMANLGKTLRTPSLAIRDGHLADPRCCTMMPSCFVMAWWAMRMLCDGTVDDAHGLIA